MALPPRAGLPGGHCFCPELWGTRAARAHGAPAAPTSHLCRALRAGPPVPSATCRATCAERCVPAPAGPLRHEAAARGPGGRYFLPVHAPQLAVTHGSSPPRASSAGICGHCSQGLPPPLLRGTGSRASSPNAGAAVLLGFAIVVHGQTQGGLSGSCSPGAAVTRCCPPASSSLTEQPEEWVFEQMANGAPGSTS